MHKPPSFQPGNRASRRARRARISRFRRDAGGILLTDLIEHDEDLAGHPAAKLIRDAIRFWLASAGARRCFACRKDFDDLPAAFLLSKPGHMRAAASVSACCAPCWRVMDLDQIEAHATRLLSGIIPGGKFLDERAPS